MSANPTAVFPDQAADFLSILRHGVNRVAKTWRRDGTISQYDDGKQFKLRRQPVGNIRVLSAILTELQSDPHSCIIRGDYRCGDFATVEEYARVTDPDHKDGYLRRIKDLVDDAPHHWVLIDVDKYRPLLADPIADPEEAIQEYIQDALPEPFRNASFHWQVSNSAGAPAYQGVLKVHLWFWLAEAATGAQLDHWAAATGVEVDRALFRVVQAHYTANPVFESGVADPVPRRSGFFAGARDTVPLDLDVVSIDTKPTRLERLRATAYSDPIAQALVDKGLVLSMGTDGKLNIECPFEEDHSGKSAESATVYYPAHTGGHEKGHFHCLHESCDVRNKRTQQEFLRKLGLEEDTAADFEALGDLTEEELEAAAPKLRFQTMSVAEFAGQPAPKWIIKGVLPKAELAVIFGESGAGKSFLALDLAASIARGVEWRGKRVKGGRVVYVVAEGAGGFRNRVVAYAQHHQLELRDIPIDIIAAAPNLLEKDQALDVGKAILAGGKADVVFVDTLAQTTPGANENAGEDMGQVLAHCKGIHKATGALVVLVHHAGKDLTKGARGWSGLRAACDAELEVSRGSAVRTVRTSKQKDGDDNEEWHFDLTQVPIGMDEDGDVVTSCVMNYDVVHSMAEIAQGPKGKIEKVVHTVIQELAGVQTAGIEITEVIKEAVRRIPKQEDGKRDRRREVCRQAVMAMAERGFFDVRDECIDFGCVL